MQFLKWSQNKEKQVFQLHRKKYRKEEGLFILEGFRAVEQAVQNGQLIFDSILITDIFKESVSFWDFMNQPTPPVYLLNSKQMKGVTTTEKAPGCMAICRIPEAIEVKELASKSKKLLALDRIQDPGNLGTIIRTALWFGWDGLLIGEGTVDLFNPKVVRSTVGATASLPFSYVKLEHALDELETDGWKVHLLDVDEKSKDLRSAKFDDAKQIVVLGNEANGIHSALKKAHRDRYHIWGSEQHLIESLNAAVALGISLYHFKSSNF